MGSGVSDSGSPLDRGGGEGGGGGLSIPESQLAVSAVRCEGRKGSVVWRKPPLRGLELTLRPCLPSSLEEDAIALTCLPLRGKLLSVRHAVVRVGGCELGLKGWDQEGKATGAWVGGSRAWVCVGNGLGSVVEKRWVGGRPRPLPAKAGCGWWRPLGTLSRVGPQVQLSSCDRGGLLVV